MIDLITGILIGLVLGGCIVYILDRILVVHTWKQYEVMEDGSRRLIKTKIWSGYKEPEE